MTSTSLVLFIDLEPNTRIDLRTAANAAIAWANLVEEVSFHFDPLNAPKIELESSQPGSQKLKTVISALTDDPKAMIRTAVVSSLLFIGGTTINWGWEQVLEWMKGPDAPQIEIVLSEEEMQILAREVAKALKEEIGKDEAVEVFGALEADENVTGAGVSGTTERRPSTVIERRAFPKRTTIRDAEAIERRLYLEKMDLVLVRPTLTDETDKRWRFSSTRGVFSATIKDESFLRRLASGALNIPLAKGIALNVDLEIAEERDHEVWHVKDYTVIKVHSIMPPERQSDFDLDGSE